MGKVFAQPTAAAPRALPTFNLYDMTNGIEAAAVFSEKPRNATNPEVRAYLNWLAEQRGVYVPTGAVYSEAGIYDEGRGYIVPMPGYGADTAVTLEELDEAGDVVRTSRIGTTKGKIGLDAAAVRKACALPKVTKARKPRATKAAPVMSPAEVSAVLDADSVNVVVPEAVEPAQTPEAIVSPSPDVSALVERLAALEAVVARLTRPAGRVRSEAERRAIVRAWRFRCEARARADLDRRALLKVNGDNRLLWETLRGVEAERDTLRDQQANARRAATDYKREGEALAVSHGRAMNRADRLARVAIASRTARRRLADDLRGSRAEARALMRKLQDARTATPAVVPAPHSEFAA